MKQIKSIIRNITEIRNWETIQKSTTELRDIGRNVINDTIASKSSWTPFRDSFSRISESEKGYPITESLGDYAYLNQYTSDSGSPISLQHSLENYEIIGNAAIEKENDDLAVLLLETFVESYRCSSGLPHMNRRNVFFVGQSHSLLISSFR